MAVMPTADRADCATDFMRNPDAGESFGITKTELTAAVNAADQWASDNAASFNTALPVAARTGLTAAQKARLLQWVIRWRWLKGV
jgi:hypothetical protein